MGDDVVEGPEALFDIHDGNGAQLDVLQPELGDLGPARLDLAGRKIDAEEAAPGMIERHGHEIAAGGAAELQHAAAVEGRRRQAEQAAGRPQMADMAPGKGIALIGHQVIGIGRAWTTVVVGIADCFRACHTVARCVVPNSTRP